MRLAFAATAILLLAGAVPVAAQEQVMPTLELGEPALGGGAFVPVEAMGVSLDVPWTYRAPAPANSPAEETSIAWEVTCPLGVMAQVAPTLVTVPPGQQQATGTASFPITATREAPGLQTQACTVTGTAAGATEALQATDSVEAEVTVAFYGNVTVSLPSATKQGGPQKQVRYPIDIANLGNTRIVVTFEIPDRPGKGWNFILPDPIVLDSPNAGGGQASSTANVVVATPYDNGYNSGAADFVVRVNTAAADDPGQVGPSSDVELTTKVKGFYVPGPQLPLLLVVLAVAVALRSRRT
jgi:hypothetical protein